MRWRHPIPLRLQFMLTVAIGVGLTVAAIGVAAALMVLSRDETLVVVAIVVLAGLVAVGVAQFFVGNLMHDIDRLRDTLVAVGEGSRVPAMAMSSGRELAELADAANMTIAKLDASETARRNLIAAVSHDLRTPITALQLLAQAVEDDIVDAETRRRYIAQTTVHIRALAGLIDDLFELSRLEAGDVAWTLRRVDMHELVEETADAMRAQADARGVRLEAALPDAIAPAHAEPDQLQRVLFNVLQNAIRHTPADGWVTISAQDAEGSIEVEVADSGAGIAPADRGRVFEPFYRGGAEAARTRSGSGLGLAISRAIVEAHGGRIWLAPSDVGTRIRFTVPVAPAGTASR